jgi:peroxiredoxin
MKKAVSDHTMFVVLIVTIALFVLLQTPVYGQKRPVLFELDTIDGAIYRLKDELGEKIILLNFWATWCRPCLQKMPHVNSLYEKYKDQNLQVLAISIDTAASRSQIRPTVNRYRFTFPILLDTDNNVIRNYSPNRNVPYLVVIGADGTIVREFSGYRPGDEKLVETIVKAEIDKLDDQSAESEEPEPAVEINDGEMDYEGND